ncbi:MAG: hypothetical protein QOJ98_3255 [Acidobacteriota bacterium]|jgi:hypothetical protein|nr:hypothetical protein [Acidobacteriota bacterium]
MIVETLMSLPQNVAVEAGYLAIRALKHLSGSVVPADEPFGKDSVEARGVAERIIHEISSTERRPVPGLGRARIDYYISKIAEVVHERVRESVVINHERGDALLAELRNDILI